MHQHKNQAIRPITTHGIAVAVLLLLVFAASGTAIAQFAAAEGFAVRENSPKRIAFDFNVYSADSKPFESTFSILSLPAANGYSRDAGKPMLPVYRQIITLPDAGEIKIETYAEQWTTKTLRQMGCDAPLVPAPAARPKSAETADYHIDSAIYGSDAFYGSPLVSIDTLGTMRGSRLALLTIAPVRYNPATRQVALCTHLSAGIRFGNARRPSHNPMTPPAQDTDAPKGYANQMDGSDTPQTYLIVAPPRFRATLQPFVAWKRQEGYIVEEYYPASSAAEPVKAHLQQRYDRATPNRPAPLFILLVGDIQELHNWPGTQTVPGLDGHRTDLYYAEFTGDLLPDALLGRLSASDTATLAQILEKTMRYERFELEDSNYLGRSLLVAGKEETPPAPTATNGQVNYLKTRLIDLDTAHDTICFYNPASDTMATLIKSHLRQGNALVSYTAHCLANGWRHPTLDNSDIDTLTLGARPFLAINNCCRANDVSGDCFGEHLLRKAQGGAIGAIGASNETLWDEDYYWCVGGSGNPTLNPQFMPSAPGAFDRMLHTHNEPAAQQAVNQSQIVLAGNWAVTASGSPYSGFYWEIYSLLGDPSLMPYIGIPKAQQLETDNIATGDITIALHGTPGSRVAATLGDTLYGVCTLDSSGNALMSTLMPLPDSLLLTATAQYRKPLQKTVRTLPPNRPRLVVSRLAMHSIDGTDITQLTLRDTAIVTVTITNAGTQTATGHTLSIAATEQQNTDTQLFTIPSLASRQDTVINFAVCPQHRAATLTLNFESADSTVYWSHSHSLDILEAQTVVKSLTMSHNGTAVHTVAPATVYDITLDIANIGSGRAKELTASIEGIGSADLGDLDADSSAQCFFHFTTPSGHDSIVLNVTLAHRGDTTLATYTFAADSTPHAAIATTTPTAITISPNPADNIVTMSGFTTPTRIVIHDLYGRIVDELFASGGQTIQYFTSRLRCGVYSILFDTGRQSGTATPRTAKLIIAR